MNQQAARDKNRKSPGKEIRVCMVCDLYLPMFSGASIQAHRLSTNLLQRGVQAFVLAGHYPGTLSEETIDGIFIKRVGLINSDIPLVRPLSSALSLLSLLIRCHRNFEVIHFHSIKAFDFIPIFFARLFKKKVIIKMSLLGSPSDPAAWAGNRFGQLTRLSFMLADRIISISNPLSENYRSSGLNPAKLWQLSQGVDLDYFHPVDASKKRDLRLNLGLDTNTKYISFVGAFKHRKGADILIEAFLALARRYPDLNLLVIGPDVFDDPVRSNRPYELFAKQLKSTIRMAGLEDRVVFTGQTGNVHAYLQSSDIFVFPSRREGFGTAIIEAMAVGLPCVLASLNGIARDITADGSAATIIDSELPTDYANAISQLLSSPQIATQLGTSARQLAVERHSMEIVAEQYLTLYFDLLAHPDNGV